MPSASSALSPVGAKAVEAVLDWLETHSGEVRLAGPTTNIGALADALAWSTQFLSTCGRLVQFLRVHGTWSQSPDVVTGMDQKMGK